MGYSDNVVVGADDIGRRFRELTPKGIKYSIIIVRRCVSYPGEKI